MPEQFTSTTFSETYKDDFADSAGYHKVLFNSGRALQARELNQLQTILQRQITRMANNIFFDGAAVNPKSSGAGTDIVEYVVVDSLNGRDKSEYIGNILEGPSGTGTSGVKFQVNFIVDATTTGDKPTLYGRYISNNQTDAVSTDVQTESLRFNAGQEISNRTVNGADLTVSQTILGENRGGVSPDDNVTPVGKGVLFSVQRAEFYVQGHFVYVPKQTIAISKYSEYVDAEVGFEVVQDIVTVGDDDALYDNQGTRPNLSSPGADRYRISMILTKKESVSSVEDFVSFAIVRASAIVQIKEGTDNFNQFEKRIADRHHDTHGNFLVNNFEIQFVEGNDSSEMIYEIPSSQLGINPVAFLDGFRLEHKVPVAISVPKPTTFAVDLNQSMFVDYKNYVTISDSDVAYLGAFNNYDDGLATQQRLNLFNASNTVIGTTRIKSLVDTQSNDKDNYRLHLYNTSMIGANNFRDTRKIGVEDSVGGAITVTLEDTSAYLTQPSNSTSLFRIPGGRVKEITVDFYTVQKQAYVQANGSGVLDLTVTSPDTFTDEGRWIFINRTTNQVEQFGVGAIGEEPNVKDITGAVANNFYDIYYYVKKFDASGVAPKTKTYREKWFTFKRSTVDSAFSSLNLVEGPFLDYTDSTDTTTHTLTTLYDGVDILEAYAIDSATVPQDRSKFGSSVLHSVEFDGGQRDNFYGPVFLRPDGVDAKDSAIRAKIGYFEWGGGGNYFSVNSYNITDSTWFDYGDIPNYVSRATGNGYPLHDYLDFRSKLDPLSSSGSASDRFDLPRDGDDIQYGAQLYNNRIDHVVVGYNEKFKPMIMVNKGEEALQPIPPTEKQNQMVLFDVALAGNTKNINDLAFNRRRYRGYKMTDVNDIERRVARLEETVSLTALEQEASNLVELTSTGEVRSKTGFFVDDFTKGYALTGSTISNEFIDDASFATSSIDEGNFTMHCKLDHDNIGFNFDANNDYYDAYGGQLRGVQTSDVVLKGDNIMLDYVEVLDSTMKQEVISWKGPDQPYEEHGYYNVNPFNVFMGEGVLRLNPNRDVWFDTLRLPDRHENGGTVIRRIGEPLIPRTFTFSRTSVSLRWVSRTVSAEPANNPFFNLLGSVQDQRGRPRPEPRQQRQIGIEATTTTDTFRVTQSVRTRVVNDQTFTVDLGDRTIDILSVPWMRQRRVFAQAQGLRPNTRYWLFMNGIKMDQWVKKIADKSTYDTHIQNGDHRRAITPANVSLRRHPDYTGASDQKLITDSKGELYFQIWIPNNAVRSVPMSTQFSAEAEWGQWIKDQRRYAKQYGSAKSVAALDAMGWKFRCGTQNVKLLDISVDNENAALSRARTNYSSWGSVSVVQRTLRHTRVVTVRDELVENTEHIGRTTSTETTWIDWTPRDPLAQTFTVDAGTGVPGVFVTKIDVFLRNAPRTATNGGQDEAIPIELQIRPVVAGVPDRDTISEQHRVFVTADSAYDVVSGMDKENLTSVLSNQVSFKFKEPVYLRSGEEYSFVLLAECDKYEAYVASTYDLVLGSTSKRVSKQPSKGSLFLSQNGSTWTPKQNQDLAYRIHTAKFKASGAANFYSEPLEKYRHNYATSLSVDPSDLNRFRVTHIGHGLGVGDKVELAGLQTTGPGGTGTYKGVLGSYIMNTANLVEDPDVNGYYVSLPDSSPGKPVKFTSLGTFGADSVETNRGFNVDRAILNFQDLQFERTGIKYQGNFVSGVSHSNIASTGVSDPRFNLDNADTLLSNKDTFFFSTPKYVANQSQETAEIATIGDSSPSIIIGASLSTQQTSTFGGSKNASSGYVSDISPVIDTQTIGMVVMNNVIDNQPVDSSAAGTGENRPANFIPESHPTLGTSPSKHITKVVQLNQAANGIKVLLDMYRPPLSSFDVYYRTGADPDEDLYENSWILATQDNNPAASLWANNDDDITFTEYRYLIGGLDGSLPDFVSYQLKIVMHSTNTCQAPVLGNIRTIALI